MVPFVFTRPQCVGFSPTFFKQGRPIGQQIARAGLLLFLFTVHVPLQAQFSGGYPFLEVGGGVTLWQQSLQSEFQSQSIPAHAWVEYGNTGSAWGLGLGVNLLSDHTASNFDLQPRYASLYLRHNLASKFDPLGKFQAFPMVGVTGWEADLTDPGKPGVIDYERKVETDRGFGVMAGFGVAYSIGKFSISPRFHAFFAGQGGYLAGQFDDQNINIGTYQASLHLSYRLYLAKGYRLNKKIKCPIP